ncbi:MAG: CPBP family intramembrane metalloprotease [bacterium]|nr:CPBP family intramembrane metalloprotease [bacterium]
MRTLVILILLPLAVIVLQLALNLHESLGFLGYSLYKIFFIVPPLIYCRYRGISIRRDILKFHNWRRGLPQALALGALSIVIFWGLYLLLGDRLLDRALIVDKLGEQFSVTAGTVLLIAPFTILVNSLLEEFFYRGFAFGLFFREHRIPAFLLPATVFTFHHILFIHQWLAPLPLVIASGGLFIFALLLEMIYEDADSIVAPWLVHLCGDIAMMSIAVTLLRA